MTNESLKGYEPETGAVYAREVFLVAFALCSGGSCSSCSVRCCWGCGAAGDHVVLILVVDKVLFVCAHFGLELLSDVVGGGREKS